ncbi:hypothetical protein GCM10009551_007240 [Nocardiopsis tropica]
MPGRMAAAALTEEAAAPCPAEGRAFDRRGRLPRGACRAGPAVGTLAPHGPSAVWGSPPQGLPADRGLPLGAAAGRGPAAAQPLGAARRAPNRARIAGRDGG